MNSQYFQVRNGNTERAHGNFDNRNLSANNPKRGVRWNEQYHTVGVWWKDANNLQFYLDGEPAGSVRTTRNLTRNLNLIWDLWTDNENFLGGVAVRNHLTNNNINTMKVDWVHTYRLVNGTTTPPTTPNPPTGGNAGAFYIINKATGKKLRPESAADGARFITANANVTSNWVKWDAVEASDGYYYLANRQTGKYFRPANADNNSLIQQAPTSFTGGFTQWRRVVTTGLDAYLQNRVTGKYFRPDANAVNSIVRQVPVSFSGNFTQWKFINADSGAAVKTFVDETKVNTSIKMFPNPVQAGSVVNVSGAEGSFVKIFDVRGASVDKVTIENNSSQIDTANLRPGLYFVQTETSTVKLLVK